MITQYMNRLYEIIAYSQDQLAELIARTLSKGEINKEIYQRYLSMQYHLTKGVQKYFIIAAANHDLCKRKQFRNYLVNFANEEELHYLVAGNDLRQMGLEILPELFDVTLWHAYFEQVVLDGGSPFVRITVRVFINAEELSSRQWLRAIY